MPPPDKRKPYPDKAHEDLARWVEETFADLATNRADIADSFLLADTLFGLSDEVRHDVGRGKSDSDDTLLLVDVLFSLLDSATASVAALQERVAALEEATPPAGPDAAG